MKKIAGLLLMSLIVLTSCQQSQQGKIGYVDNTLLKKNYNDLKKTTDKFNARQQKLDSSMRIIAQKFQAQVQEFQSGFEKMSEEEQGKKRDELLKQQGQIQQQNQARQNALLEQGQNVKDSLDKIIKSTIEDYAKANHYAFVFGDNEDDNILYAQDKQDITKEILKKLNKGETPKTDDKSADKE